MRSFFTTPLDETLGEWWLRVDPAYKRAFFLVVGVNLLAFGFEMTNLTLHHDDLWHFFATTINHYNGRFGYAPLHNYTQNGYFMPFLQMMQAIVLMTLYGLLVARFWGLRRALDLALVASIFCVFPFMAQTYQYNTAMVPHAVAHLLAALAVIASTKAPVRDRISASM